jgi:hypothetical protein
MKSQFIVVILILILAGFTESCSDSGSRKKEISAEDNNPVVVKYFSNKNLIADKFYSGFELAHDTYNAITPASDGKIYYCLSSNSIDTGGQFYAFDPKQNKTEHIGDITEICGEAGLRAIPQGKAHSNFYESNGKLYTSTHAGYYEIIDGMEMMVQNPPEGYSLYPGGHILSYDLSDGEWEDLIKLPHGEAIVTMTMDTLRNQIYIISWPEGHFFHYNVEKDELKDLGKISGNGEAGVPGEDYRVLCRSLLVDSRDGAVYFSTAEGDIWTYSPGADVLKKLDGVDLRLDYFGEYDPTRPGSMQYNWRRIVWYPGENVAYGVHGNSGYLFRFDPKEPKIEIVERITSVPSQKSGMFDYFSYGYLGFDLGPDGETLYYLTGGPVYVDGKRVEGVKEIAMGAARGLENLHLITFHLPTKKYIDHGPVFYSDGSMPVYVNSIAIAKDGTVYTLARFEHEGKVIEDLIRIPDPFSGNAPE